MACCGKRTETSREHPILIGEPDSRLYRCTVLVSQRGLTYGMIGWFTGDGVPARIAARTLALTP